MSSSQGAEAGRQRGQIGDTLHAILMSPVARVDWIRPVAIGPVRVRRRLGTSRRAQR
jgi:hypothetical protein